MSSALDLLQSLASDSWEQTLGSDTRGYVSPSFFLTPAVTCFPLSLLIFSPNYDSVNWHRIVGSRHRGRTPGGHFLAFFFVSFRSLFINDPVRHRTVGSRHWARTLGDFFCFFCFGTYSFQLAIMI
ncbi:hypothetical protein T492DRAFT_307842 [Pavlovales sp. CCMP2436]|nr:hypothetical protein T492DRAFT_307842 [Pavlovales sp. CCMP2436]